MFPIESQFVYMIMILPTLFGFVLVGEGLVKIFHEENDGWVLVITGSIFVGIVIFASFFFQTILGK